MVTGKNGLEPDPKKVKAIVEMNRPQNRKDLQSYLGMVNYLSQFSPYITELSVPLRQLNRNDVPFEWLPQHERAFNALKTEIASSKTLQFFDSKKPVIIEVDASGYGLGASLLQPVNSTTSDENLTDVKNLQPVAYASKGLTDAEQRYANIEREMLAVVFGLERFHHYTYGRKVKVITDHKPLVSIMKKSIVRAPPRLARMMLRLQKYDIELTYIPGKHIALADALSRVDPIDGPEVKGLNIQVHEF